MIDLTAIKFFAAGVGPYEMKLVISALVADTDNELTLQLLNERLEGFVIGETDKKNRPSLIKKIDTNGI